MLTQQVSTLQDPFLFSNCHERLETKCIPTWSSVGVDEPLSLKQNLYFGAKRSVSQLSVLANVST